MGEGLLIEVDIKILNKWGVYPRKPFNRQMSYMQTDNNKDKWSVNYQLNKENQHLSGKCIPNLHMIYL